MQTFRFVRAITVDGVKFAENETIGESDIPAGCFQSLKRLRDIVPHDEAPPDIQELAAAPEVPEVEDKPRKKNK